ncbi:MAG TPA: hypothetical protein VER39_11635, partial [Nocardioidaceae bacterium]|nr:hypothetical protein [Nocardioidaceae bacterium]
ASLKSDLKSAATVLETKSVDAPWAAADAATVVSVASDFKSSPGNTVTFKGAGGTVSGYCLQASNSGATSDFFYSSNAGGLVATC